MSFIAILITTTNLIRIFLRQIPIIELKTITEPKLGLKTI